MKLSELEERGNVIHHLKKNDMSSESKKHQPIVSLNAKFLH